MSNTQEKKNKCSASVMYDCKMWDAYARNYLPKDLINPVDWKECKYYTQEKDVCCWRSDEYWYCENPDANKEAWEELLGKSRRK